MERYLDSSNLVYIAAGQRRAKGADIKMKVAILSSLYAPYNVGGTEKAVRLLAESLAARGVDIVVISLYPGNDELLEEWNGIRVYRLPIDNIYLPWTEEKKPGVMGRLLWHVRDIWNWRAAQRVEEILKRERPDVLHTHSVSGFSVAVWAAAKRLGIARLHTLHDYYALCTKTTLYRGGCICERRCLDCVVLTDVHKRASHLVDVVVGVSEFITERHEREGYFAGSRKEMVTNIHADSAALRPKADDGILTFGFIGRVTKEKGIELLLEAMAGLATEACELKIAGRADASYLVELKKRFPDQRVQWLGFVPESQFYSMVDVVVIPSVWDEPLGYTCIESMFSGKSVIGSDAGGLREMIRLLPQHKLFKSGDVDALVNAMQLAVHNRADWAKSRVSSSEILGRFSSETIVDQYCELYWSICTDASRGTDSNSKTADQ